MHLKSVFILGFGALTGCVGADQPVASKVEPAPVAQTPPDGATALARVDANLARLQALSVFEVGQLVVAMPAEASNCYGPCPGSEKVVEAAKQKAALRLDAFVAVAEKAAQAAPAEACAKTAVDANLAALAGLAIVGVAGLVEEQPHNNPQCYSLPCPADIEAAAKINCERAGELANIVVAAKGL